MEIGDIKQKAAFVYTYGDVPVSNKLVYIASTDFVHIAVNWGNAERFNAELMDKVTFTLTE